MSKLRVFVCLFFFWGFAGPALGDVTIEGQTLSTDLKAMLEEELDEVSDAESLFEARRQARRASEKLGDYLNAQGYFAAKLTPRAQAGPPPKSLLIIDPGPRFTYGDIVISYGGEAPPETVQAALLMSVSLASAPYALPAAVISAEAALIDALKTQGYAFAEAMPRRILGDAESATIDVAFQIKSGPRIRLGKVFYETPVRMSTRWKERLVTFNEGDLYTPQRLRQFNRRLGNTRLYSLFSARLEETSSGTTPEGDEIRNIIVTATERARNSLTLGASFSTAEGPGTTAELTRRNATGRGDTVRLTAIVAEQEQSFGINWQLPDALGTDRDIVASTLAGRENTDAFERNFLVAGLGLEITQREHVTLTFGGAGELSRETDLTGTQRDLGILSVSGGARLDYTDSLLDPKRGWRANARIEPGQIIGDTSQQFVSLLAQASVYQPIVENNRIVLAARGRVGSVLGASTLDLPTSRRFFAGGGGSARGFGFQDIGPRDAANTPIGGRGLLELSGEARWRYSETIGFVGFVDAASVNATSSPSFNEVRYGAGVGVRYYTAIGPIRFDIATPINPQPGDNPVQVYISIGQAF